MTLKGRAHHVLIVVPDSRVRRALADLLESTDDLAVLAACATVEEADRAAGAASANAALVTVRLPGCDADLVAVARLALRVPVVAVASAASVAARAIAAGAAAFHDEDGDADALVLALRDVIDRAAGTSTGEPNSAGQPPPPGSSMTRAGSR
jgi:DNA-binding NarL/FixJ family response regulator